MVQGGGGEVWRRRVHGLEDGREADGGRDSRLGEGQVRMDGCLAGVAVSRVRALGQVA